MSTNKQSIDWYNKNSLAYTEHVRDPKQSVYHAFYEKPAMYAALPDLAGKSVLSLGCGSGEDSKHLKDLGASESTGIDISKGMIDIAADSYPDCKFQVMDMEKLDFHDNSFDFIYSSLAIHYIEYWDRALREAYRTLKPGGYFLFSCNHPVYFAMELSKNNISKKRELSITRKNDNEEVTIIGDYLAHKGIDENGTIWPVRTWHKPIGEIAKEIKDAGFAISEIIEPKPMPEMKKISLKDYKKLSKIPNFIIFKLQKQKS